MSENSVNKSKASELRKKGEIEEALPIYQELWKESGDKFDGAGLAYCLRKLKRFSEAIEVARSVYEKFPDFDWSKNEYIWGLIQGKLYKLEENASLKDYIEISNSILTLKPDEIALKVTIFKVLKPAKKEENWNVLLEWLAKISPESLIDNENEESGWNNFEIWHYYKAIALINTNHESEAIETITTNMPKLGRQKKYFLRLKAKALINLNNFKEAEIVYNDLTKSNRADWWLIQEHGLVLNELGKKDESLKKLFQAALTPPTKHEMKISLYQSIAEVLEKNGNDEGSFLHYLIVKKIREKNDWPINSNLADKISSQKNFSPLLKLEFNELIKQCQLIWNTGIGIVVSTQPIKTKGLNGKVVISNPTKHFCFINTRDGKSFFCFISDLPPGIVNGQIVIFDIISSFDKKKNEKSFKAINIKKT
jgi:tetratricopeptide (TPR) repeat protein